MGTYILALSDTYALSGVLCLASIPILIIVFVLFSKGFIVGSAISSVLCVICALCPFEGAYESAGARIPNGCYLTNNKQTKWILKSSKEIQDCLGSDGGMFSSTATREGWLGEYEEEVIYCLSYDEIAEIKATGREVNTSDWWILNEVYSASAVNNHLGKSGGIPQWVWHPAAPIYIFGFFGFPAFVGGAIISSKLS